MARNPLFVVSCLVLFALVPLVETKSQNPSSPQVLPPPTQHGLPEKQTSTALAIFVTSASQNLLRLWGLKENPSSGRSQRAT